MFYYKKEDILKENTKKKEDKPKAFNFSEFEESAIKALQTGQPFFGPEGFFNGMIKHLVEAALEGELDDHLTEGKALDTPNKRNGKGRTKQVRSPYGQVGIISGRDRLGSFEPQTVGKWQREVATGFEAQIKELYSMGNSLEDIQLHISNMYGTRLSTGAISAVTDRVWSAIKEWQERPLKTMYVLIYLDAIHFKVREEGKVISKAIYTFYAVDADGGRDILAIYVGPNEGAHQWSLYIEQLKRRGVEEVLFFAVDGLTGFGDAISRVYPTATVQRCIVHMIRTSCIGVVDKDRREVCRDLKPIYTAVNETVALEELEAFNVKWGKKHPHIARKWKENWLELTAFLDYGPEIRRLIYTTNAVENVHRQMRKVTKTKGAWCNADALLKQLFMSMERNRKSWDRTVFRWSTIQQELIETHGDRYLKHVEN
ncbi:MAG: IS256 family transposase [Saprospiraceae bacterium]|nr:IS256 family transposase [Saprospiraceae bacterium]